MREAGVRTFVAIAAGLAAVALAFAAAAHEIGGANAAFVAQSQGIQVLPFLYLGAKHMVTGYDHLLFVLGVIFLLRRFSEVVLYVTLFSLGHSATLLSGVSLGIGADSDLVDAVIGLSVAYKAIDNLGGFRTLFGFDPDARIAVPAFGLVHGLGLATKLQELAPPREGLVANLLAFNVGVEIGQILALSAMLAIVLLWRESRHWSRAIVPVNAALFIAGCVLIQYHLAWFFLGEGWVG